MPHPSLKGRVTLIRLVTIAAVVVLAALATAPVLAGRPNPSPERSASVTATPNPATVGATVWLQGCGYDSSKPAELRIYHPNGSMESYSAAVWYTGCLNPSPLVTSETGTYSVKVYQRPPRPRNAPPQLKASTSLLVQ